jgi:hypothetical protein
MVASVLARRHPTRGGGSWQRQTLENPALPAYELLPSSGLFFRLGIGLTTLWSQRTD